MRCFRQLIIGILALGLVGTTGCVITPVGHRHHHVKRHKKHKRHHDNGRHRGHGKRRGKGHYRN